MLLFQEIFQLNLRYGSVLVFPFEFKVITLETKVVDKYDPLSATLWIRIRISNIYVPV